jgi:hypothetical protein
MNQLTKAQLTVGILACFAIVWGLLQQALQQVSATPEQALMLYGMVALQLVAILILAVIILGLLEWVKIFDLKTNAILTLIVLIALRILLTI